jgi:hypothetical protein
MCEHFGKRNWLLHHDNAPPYTSFFTREFFTKKKTTGLSSPTHSIVPSFPD